LTQFRSISQPWSSLYAACWEDQGGDSNRKRSIRVSLRSDARAIEIRDISNSYGQTKRSRQNSLGKRYLSIQPKEGFGGSSQSNEVQLLKLYAGTVIIRQLGRQPDFACQYENDMKRLRLTRGHTLLVSFRYCRFRRVPSAGGWEEVKVSSSRVEVVRGGASPTL
jgi:hypothetical protein